MDVITLARNAQYLPEMIDRFYAAQLKGEDGIGMLQSRRKRVSQRQAGRRLAVEAFGAVIAGLLHGVIDGVFAWQARVKAMARSSPVGWI